MRCSGPTGGKPSSAGGSEISRRIAGRTDVVLFGAGNLGRQRRRDMDGLPFTPVAFVDNNTLDLGQRDRGPGGPGPGRCGDAIRAERPVVDHCLHELLGHRAVSSAGRSVGHVCRAFLGCCQSPTRRAWSSGSPSGSPIPRREIEAAGSVWADAESRAEYRAQVRWRFLLDYGALATPRPPAETYFPDDLISPLDREVFVDCGAFTGDTIEAFLAARGGRFERIVAIEPDAVSRRALEERVADWNRSGIGPIRVEPFAAGSRRGTVRFETTGTVGSSVGSGADSVDMAPLDEILADCTPTYIKFDVEGAEHDALVGASGTILENLPVLAVCLYHKPEDLWDLPLLIRSLGPDYRLYLRRYSDERWETVCYAVPAGRVKS